MPSYEPSAPLPMGSAAAPKLPLAAVTLPARMATLALPSGHVLLTIICSPANDAPAGTSATRKAWPAHQG